MAVYTHPAIWEAIGGTDEPFTPPLGSDDHYLKGDGAIFWLHPEGEDWMIHANVIPEAREHAFEMGQESIRYGFEVLGANKLVAEIPKEFNSVYQFALKNGFIVDDIIDGEYKMVLRYEQWAR